MYYKDTNIKVICGMNIKLVKIKFNDTSAYKYKPFKYCCDAIRENNNIIFTNEDLVDYSSEPYDEEGSCIPQFCITSTKEITSYEDSWEETYNYPIQYCPHCGEKIDISIVDEIDVSDEFTKLNTERQDLWKKYMKTDSKKKENELRNQVYELDRKINEFYELAELKDLEIEM